MRAWIRSLVFDHLSWQLRVVTGLLHALFSAWCIQLATPLSPAAQFGLVIFHTALAFPILRFTAPLETRGHWLLPQRQVILEIAFCAAALGGAVLVAISLDFAVRNLFAAPGLASVLEHGFMLGSALILAWGFVGGRRDWREEIVELPPIPTAAASSELRIVQLSDLHMGNGVSARDVEKLAQSVAALDPHLVLITGDFFDQRRDVIDECAKAVGRLSAELGVFAILGNHDAYTGTDLVVDAFARLAPNLQLLRNESFYLEPLDLWIAGIEDPGDDWAGPEYNRKDLETVAAGVAKPGQSILLMHRPEAVVIAEELGFRTVLAGHYHGGQIAVPGSGGRLNTAAALVPYDRGLHQAGKATLYVSRGLGTAGPRLRVACPGEITLHRLRIGGA